MPRRPAQKSFSSSHSSAETAATICCARISIGFSGICRASNSPRPNVDCMIARHSISSSRVRGNNRPFGSPPRRCSARPTRCRQAAIERVGPSWQTSCTAPMSMPNSSDDVATNARNSPCFSRFSASRRNFARKTSVMRRHFVLAQNSGQIGGDAFRHTPSIDKNKRRLMRLNQSRELFVNFHPDIVGHDSAERRSR